MTTVKILEFVQIAQLPLVKIDAKSIFSEVRCAEVWTALSFTLDIGFVHDAGLIGDRHKSTLVGALVLARINGIHYLEQVKAYESVGLNACVYTTQVCGVALKNHLHQDLSQ